MARPPVRLQLTEHVALRLVEVLAPQPHVAEQRVVGVREAWQRQPDGGLGDGGGRRGGRQVEYLERDPLGEVLFEVEGLGVVGEQRQRWLRAAAVGDVAAAAAVLLVRVVAGADAAANEAGPAADVHAVVLVLIVVPVPANLPEQAFVVEPMQLVADGWPLYRVAAVRWPTCRSAVVSRRVERAVQPVEWLRLARLIERYPAYQLDYPPGG